MVLSLSKMIPSQGSYKYNNGWLNIWSFWPTEHKIYININVYFLYKNIGFLPSNLHMYLDRIFFCKSHKIRDFLYIYIIINCFFISNFSLADLRHMSKSPSPLRSLSGVYLNIFFI